MGPDWIVLVPGSASAPAAGPASSPTLSRLSAVEEGRALVSPLGPFGWFDTPPSVNQVLGTVWAAEAIFPDAYEFDVPAEVRDFYQLFYHHELSEEDVTLLLEEPGFAG